MISPHEKLYSLLREGFEEVAVFGAITIVGSEGVVFQTGDGDYRTPARSVLKPFQFLGADLPVDRWQGEMHHSRYSVCLGSPSATQDQVSELTAWYRKGKAKLYLGCLKVPTAWPMDPGNKAAAELKGKRQIFHTCFSKHLGILEGCDSHGWDLENYLSQDHPFHKNLVNIVGDTISNSMKEVVWVKDGCLLPTPVLSLSEIATLYFKLATAETGSNLHWCFRLMRENPEWIGGPGRMDSLLMQNNSGVVAKEGADGLLAVGIRECERFPKGLGLIIKRSGGWNQKSAVLAIGPILESLGLTSVHTIPPGQEIKYYYTPFEHRNKAIDISPEIDHSTAVWPKDKEYRRTVTMNTENGDHMTLSSIEGTVHLGAHTDAPNHFGVGVPGIEGVDLNKYQGRCQVVKKVKAASTKTAKVVSTKDAKEVSAAAPKVKKKTTRKRTSRLNTNDKSPILESGVSRMKFISQWEEKKEKERAKAARQLSSYVERLVKKYPEEYLDKIKEALEDEEKFNESLDEINFEVADQQKQNFTSNEEEEPETEREFLEKFSRSNKPTE